MSRETDQIYKWGYEEGMKIGYEETKRETAISMAELGIPIEQIVKVVKEDAELVQKWIAEDMELAKYKLGERDMDDMR